MRGLNRVTWVPAVWLWAASSVSMLLAQSPARWLAHDMQRPRPRVVTPGTQSLPVAAPSDAIVLFDGTDLSQWRDAEGGPARWVMRDGYMESVPQSGYVFTSDVFGDVQLHVEWSAPVPPEGDSQGRGNSGVFLMGLYEVQVLDSFNNDTYPDGQAAAVYGQYPPLVNACLPPGEWQSFDIVFRRPRFRRDGTVEKPARLAVHHNGVLVQDNVEVWGPTAWLQHQPYESHADKLPISLQDHGNPVRFRNIWLRKLPEWDPAGPPPESERAGVSLTPDQIERLVGNYATDTAPFASIELNGKRLQLHMTSGQMIDLLPQAENELALRWTAGRIVFEPGESEPVPGFVFHLGGKEIRVRRVDTDP